MPIFSSDGGSRKEVGPEIPAGILGAVRTMQDDLDNKPAGQMSPVHAGNAGNNPFSPDFRPSESVGSPAIPAPSAPIPAASQEQGMIPGTGISLDVSGRKPADSRKRWLIGSGIAFAAIAVGASLAYLLFSRGGDGADAGQPDSVPSAVIAVEQPIADEDAGTVQKPAESPYAGDRANYLPIDVEVATAETLRQSFAEAGTKIIGAGMSGPVEFLVTDKNNNPIAFSRFAFIADLGLSADLVALAEEPFSVFVYADMGQARYGLALSFKDAALAVERLAKEEAKLPAEWKPFLYGEKQPVETQSAFRSGSYAGQTVRFVNVDAAQNLSFDYMTRGKQWLIGSSKDTLRAIADRVQP